MFIEQPNCPCLQGYLFRQLVLPPDHQRVQCFIENDSRHFLINFSQIYKVIKKNINLERPAIKHRSLKYQTLYKENRFFSTLVPFNGEEVLFITDRALRYLLDDLILSVLLTLDETLIYLLNILYKDNPLQNYVVTEVPVAVKNFQHIKLPNAYKVIGHKNKETQKKHIFDNDCQRLGLLDEASKTDYFKALAEISNLLPLLQKVIEKDIEINKTRVFDYRNFDLQNDYKHNIPWILKLIFELSTANKTNSPNAKVATNHDEKKQTKIYFLIHLLYHIRNSFYAGPLCKNLSDIFYVRHQDVQYSFNLFSHLGVIQSLPTVVKRQKQIAIERDADAELKDLQPCTFTYLYDNFNKTHGTHSSVYGSQQTNSVEIINRCVLSNPAVLPCPYPECKDLGCLDSCFWSKERKPKLIDFSEIYTNNEENSALTDCRLNRNFILLDEVLKNHDSLKELSTWSNDTNDNDNCNTETVDENCNDDIKTFEHFDKEHIIDNITNNIMKRDKLRRAFTSPKLSHTNQERIILESIEGKDTDPAVANIILNDILRITDHSLDNTRTFIGGDQKTMGLALRLKRLHPEKYDPIYVTIPDLHFRKSLMHSILSKYEHLGLQHLAKLSGYNKENQWFYLKNVASIHKSFEFFERLGEALRMTLIYEFTEYLISNTQHTINSIKSLDEKDFNNKLKAYIQQGSNDKVFVKNIELLEVVEIILYHYTAERTSNWALRTAVFKKILHFAVTSNCIYYGPLLIELLFHQFSFQRRYVDLLKKGFFTYKLRDNAKSAYVGNDATIEDVNLLAGQLRHKRQTAEQAVMQSNCINILKTEQENLNRNLGIKTSEFEKSFKDDRPTKIKMIRALINFKSYKHLNRPLLNEFSPDIKIFNEDILTTNSFPVADFLIRRYISQNESLNICNKDSLNKLLKINITENAATQIKKLQKNSSFVINIKAVIKDSTSNSNKQSIKLKRKAKQILDNLLWEESSFETAAAIVNHDGSKLNTNKSKFREAISKLFSNSPLHTDKNKNQIIDFQLEENEWLSDAHINHFTQDMKERYNPNNITITYPMPVDVLCHMIQTTNNIINDIVQNSSNYAFPLNTGKHWVILFFYGHEKTIYYIDSFGSSMPKDLALILRNTFVQWSSVINTKQLQEDSYQCGVWSCYFIAMILEYLKNKRIATGTFHTYFNQSLSSNSLQDVSQQSIESNSSFIKDFRKHCSSSIDKNINKDFESRVEAVSNKYFENKVEAENNTNICKIYNFKTDILPSNINFNVVSVDSQQSLWVKPFNVDNGIEYIKFLDRRYFYNFFHKMKVKTVYWNYDMHDLIKQYVPKTSEQIKRDKGIACVKSFSESRLMNEENSIITNTSIIKDWNEVITDRKKRNIVAKYVATNLDSLNLLAGQRIIINSEAILKDDYAIPMLYQSNGVSTMKIIANELKNTFVEGEGAAAAQIAKHHLNENCLVISNDTDSLLYMLLASLKRERVNNIFKTHWWLEIPILKKSITAEYKRHSEYWDINELIYSIEEKLPNSRNPVPNVVILYLAAGSDITEKWFGKTHKLFLEKFIENFEYIGDLVSEDITTVKAFEYRKLIHCVWQKSLPEKVSFNEVRTKSSQLKNKRSKLPEEITLLNHYRRVNGAYKYMSNYFKNSNEKVNWLQHGYSFDTETKSFSPVISNASKKEPKKAIPTPRKHKKGEDKENKVPLKKVHKSKEQLQILQNYFNESNVNDTKRLDILSDKSGLSKKQICDWFSKERRKRKLPDGNDNPSSSKIIRI